MKYFPFILISFIVITLVAITHGDKHDILKQENTQEAPNLSKIYNTRRKIFRRAANDFDIDDEIYERQKRIRNLVIFGVPESESDNPNAQDKMTVTHVLKILLPNYDFPQMQFQRLGRFNPDKNRPIRVTLNDKHEVAECIRNANLLKTSEYKHVSVAFDRTTRQLKEYYLLKEELARRHAEGPDRFKIRFIDGTPKLIKLASFKDEP